MIDAADNGGRPVADGRADPHPGHRAGGRLSAHGRAVGPRRVGRVAASSCNDGDGVSDRAGGGPQEQPRVVRRSADDRAATRWPASTRSSGSPIPSLGRLRAFPDQFVIESSSGGPTIRDLGDQPDAAICPQCAADVLDPLRPSLSLPVRHVHQQCGPRYSIAVGQPFDRDRRPRWRLPICVRRCASEYGDEADRRYHAQAMACFVCGPQAARLERADGRAVSVDATYSMMDAVDAVATASDAGRDRGGEGPGQLPAVL